MSKVACKGLPYTMIFFLLMATQIKPGTSAMVIKTNNRRTFYEITKQKTLYRGKSSKQNNKKDRILPTNSRHVLLQPPQAFKSRERLFFLAHWINLNPIHNQPGLPNTYSLRSVLSDKYRYPTLKQPRAEL